MKIADIPSKFNIPFASSAGAGFTRPIPQSSQIGVVPGAASLTDGFPPLNFEQIASGGVPPWGADMNGLMNQVTLWLRWATAGGYPPKYDAAFSSAIGGYPKGALIQGDTLSYGNYFLSLVDDNASNPNSGGANWSQFPDAKIQIQAPNYGVDTGPVNQVTVTLSRVPASFAEIVGSPIRVKIANGNTITNPTIAINGLTPAVMVCPDGSALAVGQLAAGGIMEGLPRDDGKFQVNLPIKAAAASGFPFPGATMPWWNETPPAGWIEIGGQTLLISSYPNLFAVLGTRYGGDGVNNFAMPNTRGEFIRGWDHGRGLDPDAATRGNAGGGITGDHVGTTQLSAAGNINLTGQTVDLNNIQTSPDLTFNPLSANNLGLSQLPPAGAGIPTNTAGEFDNTLMHSIRANLTLNANVGSTETRPVNLYAMWIMFTGN